MRNRMILTGLYLVAVLSFAYATSVPPWGWAILAATAVVGPLRALHPAVRFLLELLLAACAFLFVNPWGFGLTLVMAAAALSISRAQKPSADRAIIGSLLITTVAAFVKDWAAAGLLILAGLAVLALVEGSEGSPDTARQRTKLALTLALIAAAGALAVGLVVRLMPWKSALALIFGAIAYPFFALFSSLHINPSALRHSHSPVGAAPHHPAASQTGHVPLPLTIVFVVLGIALLALILYAAYRHWAQNEELPEDPPFEDGIVRETLANQAVDPFRRFRQNLTPVRRLVFNRLSQARRHKLARNPSETLREWIERGNPGLDAEVPELYEDVRYGGSADTPEKLRRMQELWPRH